MKELSAIKYGLVLEGGAMRGLFSAGVMDSLMEAGITFDGIIGVSAGKNAISSIHTFMNR